jgi:hypothetical protein
VRASAPKRSYWYAAVGIVDSRVDAKSIHAQKLPFFWDERQGQDALANQVHGDDIDSPFREPSSARSFPVLYRRFGYATYVRFALPVSADHSGACLDFPPGQQVIISFLISTPT